MNKPLVSILINNYNYGIFLSEAIDSALNQEYQNIEVIVVDDGSTDNSYEIIQRYGERIIPVLKENGGQASAFNAGFQRSEGDIICFLDSDDIYLSNKVTEIVNLFTQYGDIGWVFHYLKLVRFSDGFSEEVHDRDSVRLPSQLCDFRSNMLKGDLKFNPPPTSGLSFSRALLSRILPMPEQIRITSDNYLKFISQALDKGFCLDKELTIQRIHNNNAFTLRKDRKLKAVVDILTSYHIREKHPELSNLTNKYFSRGASVYFRCGSLEKEYTAMCRDYMRSMTLIGKIVICCKIVSWLFVQSKGKFLSLGYSKS